MHTVSIYPTEKMACLEEPLLNYIPDDALDELPAVNVVQLHAVGDLVGRGVVFEPTEGVWVEVIGVDLAGLLLPGIGLDRI